MLSLNIGGSMHGGAGGSMHGGAGGSMHGAAGGSMHGNGAHSVGGSKHAAGGSMRGGGGYFGSYAENMYGAGFGGSLHGGSILSGLGPGGMHTHGAGLHGGGSVHGGSALTTSQSIAALALSLGVSPSSFTDSGLDALPQLSSETRHVLRGSSSAAMPMSSSLLSTLPSLAASIPPSFTKDPSLPFPSWHQQLQQMSPFAEPGLPGNHSQAPPSRSSGMAIRASNTSPFAASVGLECGNSDLERSFPAFPQSSAPAVLYSLSGEGSVHSGNNFNRTASVNRFRLKRFLRLQALTEAGAKKVRAEARRVLADAKPRASGRAQRSATFQHDVTHSDGSPPCLSPAKCSNTNVNGNNSSSGGGHSTEGSNLAMASIVEEAGDHLEGDSGGEREFGKGQELRHHGSNLFLQQQQHLPLPLPLPLPSDTALDRGGSGGSGRDCQLEARLVMQEQQLLLQRQGRDCWLGMGTGEDKQPQLQPVGSNGSGHRQQQYYQVQQQGSTAVATPVAGDKDAALTPLQRRWQQQQQQQQQLPQAQQQPQQTPLQQPPQQQQQSILPFLLDDDHITDQDLAALGLEDLLPADMCQSMLDDSEASGDSIYMRPQQQQQPAYHTAPSPDNQQTQQQQQPQPPLSHSTQPMDICGMGGLLDRSMFSDMDLCHADFDAQHHDLLSDDPLDCALKVFM
ncbi:MAG: hypothetical protein WDW38_001383 [Sanguina aurantia]